MTNDRNRVCPVELSHSLDNKLRRWLQNPRKILAPYVKEGMTVLDVGCGPGFFSIELAAMVGPAGKVVSADLQPGMLEKLREKIRGTTLENRITIVECAKDSLNVSGAVDFGMAFYVVHEIPDKGRLFKELRAIMKKGGRFLIVEPKLFHVSKEEFDATIQIAGQAGFTIGQGPTLPMSWSAMLS